jgi:hypothetical protein
MDGSSKANLVLTCFIEGNEQGKVLATEYNFRIGTEDNTSLYSCLVVIIDRTF